MNQPHDYTFKLLVVGDSGVGKSSLLLRYAEDSYTDTFLATIGVDFKLKSLKSQDDLSKSIKLQIWDTAGQERFRTITSSYYRGSHGVLVLYDITDLDSFRNAEQWLREVDRFSGMYSKNGSALQKMLVGCKLDLEHKRQVSEEEALEFAHSMDIHYMECSAKDNSNVALVFDSITHHMYNTCMYNVVGDDGDGLQTTRNKKYRGGRSVLLNKAPTSSFSSAAAACGC